MNKNGLQKPATTMSKLVFWGVTGILMAAGSLSAPAAFAQTKVAAKPKAAATKSAPAKAAAPAAVSPTAPAEPVVGNDKSARVTVLDKQTNRRQVVVLIAGTAQVAGNVQVKLTKCMADHKGVLGQDVAWLDVTDATDTGRAPWFSGWMFNTYPEVSTLDHPRYDVQLQGCGTKARQLIKATGSAPILDTTSPVVDTETPNDVPAATEGDGSTSADPYVVPGVKDESPAPVAQPVVPQEQPAAPVDQAPIAQPVAPTPAASVPQDQPAQDGGNDQGDLHRMMDSGQY